MALKETGVRLVAEDASSFISTLGRADNAVDSFGKAAEGTSTKTIALGTAMGNLISSGISKVADMMTQAGKAVVGFIGEGVTKAADLEKQMDAVSAVMGLTGEEAALLGGLVKDLGLDPNLTVDTVQAAEAVEMLARNGLSLDQIMDGAARSTVALANATGADFSVAANVATDAMALFNIEADDMSRVVDGVAAVASNSKYDINDYAYALSNGAAAAADMGVTLEDFNTVIATSADEMGSGMKAGTGFNNFITRLTPSTKTATEKMMELNLVTAEGQNVFFDAQGTLKDMNQVSIELNKSLAGLTDAERSAALETIFGNDAKGVAIALAKEGEVVYTDLAKASEELGISQEILNEYIEDGITGFEILDAKMSMTDGAEAAATRVDNLRGALDILSGVVESVQMGVGEALIPAFTELARATTNFLSQNSQPLIDFFGRVGEKLSDFSSMFSEVLSEGGSPFEALLAGISEAGFSDFANGVWNVINTFQTLRDTMDEIGSRFQMLYAIAQTYIQGGDWEGLGNWVIGRIQYAFTQLWEYIQPTLMEWWMALQEWVSTIDWYSLGSTIANTLVSGIELWAWLESKLWGFYASVFEWFFTQDWGAAGDGVTSKLLAVWTGFKETLIPVLQGWFTTFQEWFNSVDWVALGYVVNEKLTEAWTVFKEQIFPLLVGWGNSFATWFNSVDWGALAQITIDGLTALWGAFSSLMAPTLQGWWDTFTNWFKNVDWKGLASTAITSLINSFRPFSTDVKPVLTQWHNSFVEWVNNADWESIAKTTVTSIIDGYVAFYHDVGVTLAKWYLAFSDWAANADWAGIAAEVIDAVTYALSWKWASDIPSVVADWFTSSESETASIDWASIGWDIVSGIVGGLTDKAGDLAAAAKEMAQNAWQAAKSYLGIESPSKLFMDLGNNVIDGFVIALNDGESTVADAVKGLFGFTSVLGSLGNAAVGEFKRTMLDPLNKQIKHQEDALAGAWGRLKASLGEDNLPKDLAELSRLSREGSVFDARDARLILDIERELADKKEAQAAAEAKILELQEQQQRLGFLKSQLDLLNFMRENGLDASALGGGFQFGANADPLSIVNATANAFEQVISRVSGALNPAGSLAGAGGSSTTNNNSNANTININGANQSPEDLAQAIVWALSNV